MFSYKCYSFTLFIHTDDFKLVTNRVCRKAIRNQFAICQFLVMFTRTWLNRFYISCEGGVLGGVLTRALQRLIVTERFCGLLTYGLDEEIDV